MHLACLGVLFTGVHAFDVVLCVLFYLVRMFGITAGYHRYFAHRAYKTSRPMQFLLAWLGCSALQKGPLWWASHHRVSARTHPVSPLFAIPGPSVNSESTIPSTLLGKAHPP